MANTFKVLSSTSSSISSTTAELEDLLSKIGDKEVAVYSINGKFKTGKSFMLNFMLRFLIYGKSYRRNWIYMDLPTQFACDGGSSKCTVGIDVWPQVFSVDVGNGKEVAVLLMDTQGLFDDESPVTDNHTVFAFSALLSSCTIYNVMNTMDQRDWQFLDFLMSFVNQAIHSTLETSEFEKDTSNLNILIRDWEHNNAFSFGTHTATLPAILEGNLYHHFFEKSRQTEESENRNSNRSVLSLFNKCSVTALPYPGKELATTKNAAATSGDPEFIEKLKVYVEGIFSPEVVLSNRKKVGGCFVTGGSLSQLVSKWSTYFKSSSLPAPHSIYLTTAELQHINLIKKLEEGFKISVAPYLEVLAEEPTKFGVFLQNQVSVCIQKFDNFKLLGKEDFAVEYKEILSRNLHTLCNMFMQKSELKNQDAAANRERAGVEKLMRMQQQQVEWAAKQANLEAERKRRELQRLQEELERQKQQILDPSSAHDPTGRRRRRRLLGWQYRGS